MRICLLLLLTSACAAQPPRSSQARDYTAALRGTVTITDEPDGRTSCSGVMWRGVVVTAAHCVRDDITYYLGQYESTLLVAADVELRDEARDIAVLRPGRGWDTRGDLHVAFERPQIGEPVTVVGHPLGYEYTIQTGLVASPERPATDGIPLPWMQITAPVLPGNSGGPVLNEFDEIVGIVSFIVIDHTGHSTVTISGAVPWRVIVETLAGV